VQHRFFFGRNPAKSRGLPGVLRTIVRVVARRCCKNPNPNPDPVQPGTRKPRTIPEYTLALPEPQAKKWAAAPGCSPIHPNNLA